MECRGDRQKTLYWHRPGFVHLEEKRREPRRYAKRSAETVRAKCSVGQKPLILCSYCQQPRRFYHFDCKLSWQHVRQGDANFGDVLDVFRCRLDHLTLVSRANLSPISSSTTPFRVSFKPSNSFTPFVMVSTFEPS